MSSASAQAGAFVGMRPWLPWPLSAWRWWTEPVRAERLAMLRIGLALLLLVDVLATYLPHVGDLFAQGGLGSRELFAWWSAAPRFSWSLLRGPGDPLVSFLAFGGVLVGSVLLIGTLWGRTARSRARSAGEENTESLASASYSARPGSACGVMGYLWVFWVLSVWLFTLGVWARLGTGKEDSLLFLGVPAAFWAVAGFFFLGEFLILPWLQRRREIHDPEGRPGRRWALLGWSAITLLFLWGLVVSLSGYPADPEESGWSWLATNWQASETFLDAAMGLWVVSIVLMIIGWQTRLAAVLVWVLSTSFANLNPYIDNAGDVIRGIMLFYLMLCPCGAALSVDRWLERRRGVNPGPIVISPWALRLLFVQMTWIYFSNGVFKLAGSSWQQGESLYYVLCDLTLTRFSFSQLPLPLWATQVMTWSVLVWEAGFPLWVLCPWTRTIALVFGVMFHLGIFVSMELGGFGPYMMAMYLPLLPWERWLSFSLTPPDPADAPADKIKEE